MIAAAQLPVGLVSLLWPSAVALVFVLLFVLALVLRWKRLRWPFLLAAVIESLAAVLVWLRVLSVPKGAIVMTVVAIVSAALLGVLLALVVVLRARALERKMVRGLAAEAPGADQQQIERLRRDMAEALDLLRKAGKGKSAIYTLPWFLVVGRPQAGKTVAIKNSGLNLPVRKDWVKGVGGTHTCDWFFTNELIFLDTPGKWVSEGGAAAERKTWSELFRMLRKHRARRPLDGVVVVVPSEDLLGRPESEVRAQAARVRELMDLVQEDLGFRFPVYVLVSKCDLVEGFVDFFRGLPPQRKQEILGWSSAGGGGRDPGRQVRDGMTRVRTNLAACRVEMLARVSSRRQARRLFYFAEEFGRLTEPLAAFADVLFREDPYHEAPFLRGFYFTSGTQGEGTTLGRAMAELARSLGVPTPPRAAGGAEEEPKRSYFLLDLFRKLLPGDGQLVGRTAGSVGGQRRSGLLLATIPAALGVVLLALSLISLTLNAGVYRSVGAGVPDAVKKLGQLAANRSARDVPAALALTDDLRGYERKLAGFSFFRGFGMRRAHELAGLTAQAFQSNYRRAVLEPTLAAAAAMANDANVSCADRVQILHGVVRLRLGGSWFSTAAPAGFEKVWQVKPEQAERPREQLLEQYAVYRDGLREHAGAALLPGFSIRGAADSIRKGCFGRSGVTPLEAYQRFQSGCATLSAPAEMAECYRQLNEVLRQADASSGAAIGDLEALRDDLGKLAKDDPEAAEAKAGLDAVQAQAAKADECLGQFATDLAPAIRDYANQDQLLEQCKDELKPVKDLAGKQAKRDEVIKAQNAELKAKEDPLKVKLQNFSDKCRGAVSGFQSLDMGLVRRITEGYRRVRCLGIGSEFGEMGQAVGGRVKGKFPFSPQATELADEQTMIDLFGGKTGMVVSFLNATGGKGISPAVQAWLAEGAGISRLFFDEGSDTLRPLRLRVTLQPVAFEPADAGKEWKLQPVILRLGPGQELTWKEGDPPTQQATVALFGASASEVSSAAAVISQRKGFLGRTFGSDYKEGKPTEIASVQGTWAPIRLFQKGTDASGTVSFTIALGEKQKQKATLRFKVEGADLARLYALMRRGLPAPPAQAAAE